MNIKKKLLNEPPYQEWKTRLNLDRIRNVMNYVPGKYIRMRTLQLAQFGPEGPKVTLEMNRTSAAPAGRLGSYWRMTRRRHTSC